MPNRTIPFAPGEMYHLFTRGVEKRNVFLDNHDRERFISLLTHCLSVEALPSFSFMQRLGRKSETPKEGRGLVDILCYCLMENHFHLLLKENIDGGISTYIHRLLTSYSRYFNVKYKRSGSLFVHPFKSVHIEDDNQLLHESRYIHLNPYVARMGKSISGYKWSSIDEYFSYRKSAICHTGLIKSMMTSGEYKNFVSDHADFAREVAEEQGLFPEFDD